MSSKWKNRKLKVAAALVFLMAPGLGSIASAQTPTPPAQVINVNDSKDVKATPAATSDDDARLAKFLDKKGGYKDKTGGYYDPKAGTYTDSKGGVVDNWGGYTYTDGSYKSKMGDYYDASTKTFTLSSGEKVALPKETTNDDARGALRGSVEDNGGYDKDFVRKSMMVQIKAEHPASPPPASKTP